MATAAEDTRPTLAASLVKLVDRIEAGAIEVLRRLEMASASGGGS